VISDEVLSQELTKLAADFASEKATPFPRSQISMESHGQQATDEESATTQLQHDPLRVQVDMGKAPSGQLCDFLAKAFVAADLDIRRVQENLALSDAALTAILTQTEIRTGTIRLVADALGLSTGEVTNRILPKGLRTTGYRMVFPVSLHSNPELAKWIGEKVHEKHTTKNGVPDSRYLGAVVRDLLRQMMEDEKKKSAEAL
jgi:hypothetical protein